MTTAVIAVVAGAPAQLARAATEAEQAETLVHEGVRLRALIKPRWTPKTGALSSERRNISAIMCATCAEENGCVVEQTMEGV